MCSSDLASLVQCRAPHVPPHGSERLILPFATTAYLRHVYFRKVAIAYGALTLRSSRKVARKPNLLCPEGLPWEIARRLHGYHVLARHGIRALLDCFQVAPLELCYIVPSTDRLLCSSILFLEIPGNSFPPISSPPCSWESPRVMNCHCRVEGEESDETRWQVMAC